METNALIVELITELKSCLPTMNDALSEAKQESNAKPRWLSVVSAYESQIARIQSLIQRAESQ